MDRNSDYLTIQQAAQATGLSEKAIRRRVERGTLESVVLGSRRVVPRAALGVARSDEPVSPDAEALARLQDSVKRLARRMDALEVWVLRSLNEHGKAKDA